MLHEEAAKVAAGWVIGLSAIASQWALQFEKTVHYNPDVALRIPRRETSRRCRA